MAKNSFVAEVTFNAYMHQKTQKNNLTSLLEIADKVFFYIVEHLPLVAEWCFIVDCYFKLSSFLPCALNYDK